MAFNMLDYQLDPTEFHEFYEFPEYECPVCSEIMDLYPRQLFWKCPMCAMEITEPEEVCHDDDN